MNTAKGYRAVNVIQFWNGGSGTLGAACQPRRFRAVARRDVQRFGQSRSFLNFAQARAVLSVGSLFRDDDLLRDGNDSLEVIVAQSQELNITHQGR